MMLKLSPTLKQIILRTLPLTLGLFSIMLVQLVDSVFIGMLGVDELTVHGLTLPFQALLVGLQVGIGVAATSIIAQACGACHQIKATTTATLSVVGGTLFMASICVILWINQHHIFNAFISGHTPLAQRYHLQILFTNYWPYWLFSALMVAVLYLTSCVYRANQDTKITGKMFLAASLINLVLDPLLIFTFKLGMIGAAISSSIGYASCALFMVYRANKLSWFGVIRWDRSTWEYTKDLISMAVPTTTNQMLPSISSFIAMMLVSRLGTDAIAFWSLFARIESFLLVFTLALTMSVPPMIGRYLGENKHEKITKLLAITTRFLLIYHACIALILIFCAHSVVALIDQQANIASWLNYALKIVPISYGPLGVCMLMVSACNALRAPNTALSISFIRLIVLYIPAVTVGIILSDIHALILSVASAYILSGLYAWYKIKQKIQSFPCFIRTNSIPQ
ncbi:MATE family efflux transporter [Vibrio gallicus]|uniref:MATE family efflux transporter n=1 Tax=Vibrio gallicus TaxID=190897 RepID=UPI0021C38619|nr:MATE family efflux transporter [Vibrio gallicus]